MKLRFMIIVFSLFSFFLLPSLALAIEGPDSYLVEQVKAHFDSDGSYSSGTYAECNSNPCMYGYVQVAPPNNEDVLQYIRVNISGSTTNTNLQSNTSYRGSLGSTGANPVTIDVNTSDSDPDTEYNITDADEAPPIRINLSSISNWQGGYDIYDSDNIYPSGSSNPNNTLLLNFSICNLGSTKNLYGVDVTIQFNNSGTPDTFNVTTSDPGETGGSATRVDGDSGGGYDRVTWAGTLQASNCTYVWFNITTTEGVNFPNDNNFVDMDDAASSGNSSAYYDNTTATLSGRTISGPGPYSGRFSRGPMRQGIDLAQSSTNEWIVRGFLMSRASLTGTPRLVYNLSSWYVYQIDNSTGTPMTPANQSGTFDCSGSGYCTLYPDNDTIYTTTSAWSGNSQWFDTNLGTGGYKPYYAVGFDWEVVWNDTYYRGYINTTYDLRTLYKIDMVTEGIDSYGAVNPGTGNENVTLNYTTRFTGSNTAAADYVEIFAVVPARPWNVDADHGNWTIDSASIQVWANYTGTWDQLSSGTEYNYTYSNPDAAADVDGYVRINITDVSSVGTIGHDLQLNERIRLRFNVTSHSSMQSGDKYNFTGNSTMKTGSGTPLAEIFTPAEEISLGGKQLTGWKELIGDVNNPTWITSNILIEVVSASLGDTIDGIKFMDYVSQGTNVSDSLNDYKNAVTFYIWNGTTSGWVYYEVDTNFSIARIGTTIMPDGTNMTMYEYNTSDGLGWSLGNGEKINVTYTFNVSSSGAYVLPTVISGFDPDTGIKLGTVAIGSIYVEIPEPLLSLDIEEGEFSQAKNAVVNKPVLWMKDFQVYNPNGRPARARFTTRVFADTTEGYASYYDEYGNKIEETVSFVMTGGKKIMQWESTINPFEARDYEVRVLTPPVMEVDRNVEVLEKLPQKKVKIIMDVFLKNFAKEDYENVVLNLPIGLEDLIQARDSFGHELQFSGGAETSKVMGGDIKADAMKSLNIIYRQSYPTIIVTPEKDEFILGSPVGLNILVINGGDKVDYPYLEIEIYTPGMDVIKSDVLKIESMQPLEKTELTERYFLPLSAPTGLYLASVSFRQDFATLASGTGQFFLTGGEEGLTQTWGWILLFIVIIAMGYLSYKRLQSVRGDVKKFRGRVV